MSCEIISCDAANSALTMPVRPPATQKRNRTRIAQPSFTGRLRAKHAAVVIQGLSVAFVTVSHVYSAMMTDMAHSLATSASAAE